jgi:hypothetical protein
MENTSEKNHHKNIFSFMSNSSTDKNMNNLLNDLAKFATIMIIINIFFFISNPSKNVLLGENYLLFMSYIGLGLGFYWLVIARFISFD